MPSRFYERYRLVSCELRITFTASSFTSSGYCTLGASYDTASAITDVGNPITAYSRFGSFSNIENTKYRSSTATVQGKQLSMLYLPPDVGATEFVDVDVDYAKYKIVGYISGAPASTNVARLDVYANYEAIVAEEFADYFPTTSIKSSAGDLSKTFVAISNVRGNIMDKEVRKEIIEKEEPGALVNDQIVEVPKDKVEIKEKHSFLDKLGNIGLAILEEGLSLIPVIGKAAGRAVHAMHTHQMTPTPVPPKRNYF
jgi:hypothetical protein